MQQLFAGDRLGRDFKTRGSRGWQITRALQFEYCLLPTDSLLLSSVLIATLKSPTFGFL